MQRFSLAIVTVIACQSTGRVPPAPPPPVSTPDASAPEDHPPPAPPGDVPVAPPPPDASAPAASCAVVAETTLPPPTHGDTLTSVRIAAVGATARLVWTLRPADAAHDAVPSAVTAVIPADLAAPVHPQHLPVSAAGCSPPSLAAPVARDGLPLATFGLSSRASSPIDWQFLLVAPPLADTSDPLAVPRGPLYRAHFFPRDLTALAHGPLTLALATGHEQPCSDMCSCASTGALTPAVRTVVWSPAGVTSEVIYRAPNRTPEAQQPNVPAIAYGAMRGAAVFRALHGLIQVWLDPAGRRVGEITRLADGDVGAPTVAFRGETLLVVWAWRESPASPYVLRAFNWAPGEPTGFTVTLPTGPQSAFAPALATSGDTTLLAWMQGDPHHGTLRLGATRDEIAHVTDHPLALTPDDGNARDPELAVTPERTLVTYTTYDAQHPGGVLSVAAVRCL